MQPTTRRAFRVGLDLDGVLADFVGHPETHGFCKTLVDAAGRDLFPKPWLGATLWNWWTPLGYTTSDSNAAWLHVKNSGTFWQTLRPYQATREVLATVDKLRECGYCVPYFLTTRPGARAHAESVEWLKLHGMPNASVVICANADAKGVMARELQLDMVIDDHCENLLAIKAHSRSRIALFDQPWSAPNRDRVLSCGAIVIRGQEQLLDKLKEWSGV